MSKVAQSVERTKHLGVNAVQAIDSDVVVISGKASVKLRGDLSRRYSLLCRDPAGTCDPGVVFGGLGHGVSF